MAASNSELQKDELEVLKSIYGADFVLDPFIPNSFSIVIHIGDKEGEEVTLMVTFVKDYPTNSLPMYSLSIPWLRGEQKQELIKELEQIYRDSNGEAIIYSWAEKLRELLTKPELNPKTKQQELPLPKENSTLEEEEELKDIKLPLIVTGEPLTDRKSTFQAHLACVESVHQVRLVLTELKKNKKIASATHNMYAYRICTSSVSATSTDRTDKSPATSKWIQNNDDDGETHAGERLLHLLQILDCKNVLVVVTRWFGGVMLYGDRFKHINNVARTLLSEHGFINVK